MFNIILRFDGVFNGLLGALGFDGVDWIGDQHTAFLSVISVAIWSHFGMSVLIFLSGLATFPSDIIDAAKIDGASLVQIILRVILSADGPDDPVRLGDNDDLDADGDVRADLRHDAGRAWHGDLHARIPDLADAGRHEPARLRDGNRHGVVPLRRRLRIAADHVPAAGRHQLMAGMTRARRWSADSAVLWSASAGMMVLAISTIFPLLFTLNTSLKSSREFIADNLGLVTRPVDGNFVAAWSSFNIGSYAANSTVATVTGVLLSSPSPRWAGSRSRI